MNKQKVMSILMLIIMVMTYVSPVGDGLVNIIDYELEASETESDFTFEDNTAYANIEMDTDGVATLSNYQTEGFNYFANDVEVDPSSSISLNAGDNTISVTADEGFDINNISSLKYTIEDSSEAAETTAFEGSSEVEEASAQETSATEEETSTTEEETSATEEEADAEETSASAEETSASEEASTEETSAEENITGESESSQIEAAKTTGGFCDELTADDFDQACDEYPISFENNGFEEPIVTDSKGFQLFDESLVPGWFTTDDGNDVEIQTLKVDTIDSIIEGDQFAEINASNTASSLYQDFETTPGQTLYYSVWHGGRKSTANTMNMRIGRPNNSSGNTKNPTTGGINDNVFTSTAPANTWDNKTGSYTIPSGQTTTRIAFVGQGNSGSGNLLDDIQFVTLPVYDMDTNVTQVEGNTFNVSSKITHYDNTDVWGTNELTIDTTNIDSSSIDKSAISVTDQNGTALDYSVTITDGTVVFTNIEAADEVNISFNGEYITTDAASKYYVTADSRLDFTSSIKDSMGGN